MTFWAVISPTYTNKCKSNSILRSS